ncbi:MAG: FMN-binding protein [Chloroflexi bacterium]|nr:FMN-binding protein [Chloroflexota bacterium]
MARKMSARLVALSASAVATIYVAGLLATQPAAAGVAAAAAAPVASVSTSTGGATPPTVVVGASSTPASTPSTATNTYADGTYSGTGTSRFGNVSVLVTIAAGKITNVQITRVTTSYPASRIASLPAQVVAGQSANVNAVTGATYSSAAFKSAVLQALTQALPASSTTSTGAAV